MKPITITPDNLHALMKHEYPHPQWKPRYDLNKSSDFLKVLLLVVLCPVRIIVLVAIVLLYLVVGESEWMACKTDMVFKWCLV